MSHKGFSHIGLSTPHLDKTCEFYEVQATELSQFGVLNHPAAVAGVESAEQLLKFR
jgi:hypothetical protein